AALPALFVLARHGVLHSTAQVTTPLSGTHGQTLVDMLAVPLLYARTMLGIPPFLPDYSFMRGGSALLTPANLAGLLLLTGTAVLFLWGVWRRGTHGAVALGLGWLGLALFPVSNLVPMMQYFAERFVYLPLVGALIAGAGLLSVLAARRPKVVPAAAALVAVWAVVATGESAKWRNEQTLIFHAYHNSPPARRIVSNYLTVLDRAGDDRGIEEALARHPDLVRGDADLQWLVGRIRTRQGRLEEARRWLEPLTETLGRKPEYLLDLGIFHAQSGDTARARRLFTRVTREWPTVPRGWTCLGLNLSGSGSYSAAIPALRNAVRLNPNDVFAWKALARAALKRKDWALSRTALARLAQLDPADGRHAQLLKKMPRAP
ncbi:MAG TPA: tetratricopeptide repeat protein, partial [Armatimonadota bacterium]|nr:tetratricopeptide repeat protein [Armatimonadota bacterium]